MKRQETYLISSDGFLKGFNNIAERFEVISDVISKYYQQDKQIEPAASAASAVSAAAFAYVAPATPSVAKSAPQSARPRALFEKIDPSKPKKPSLKPDNTEDMRMSDFVPRMTSLQGKRVRATLLPSESESESESESKRSRRPTQRGGHPPGKNKNNIPDKYKFNLRKDIDSQSLYSKLCFICLVLDFIHDWNSGRGDI